MGSGSAMEGGVDGIFGNIPLEKLELPFPGGEFPGISECQGGFLGMFLWKGLFWADLGSTRGFQGWIWDQSGVSRAGFGISVDFPGLDPWDPCWPCSR